MDLNNVVVKLKESGLSIQSLRITNGIHPSLCFEAPCVVQSEIDTSTEIAIGSYTGVYGGRLRHVRIGRYCSIAPGVQFGWDEHPIGWLTSSMIGYVPDVHGFATYSGLNKDQILNFTSPFKSTNGITNVGNDVWIGYGAFIKSGVTIGDGAIVGAGSIVVNDVEPYSIVGGVPAKTIKMRFSQELITELKQIEWWRFDAYRFPPHIISDINGSINWLNENIKKKKINVFKPKKITSKEILAWMES